MQYFSNINKTYKTINSQIYMTLLRSLSDQKLEEIDLAHETYETHLTDSQRKCNAEIEDLLNRTKTCSCNCDKGENQKLLSETMNLIVKDIEIINKQANTIDMLLNELMKRPLEWETRMAKKKVTK